MQIKFPFNMDWYEEQPCTEFQFLQHRKEPKGFRHEFIVLKLDDDSICRIERIGDPSARLNALTSQGSVAHDIAQCYRVQDKADACLDTSEVVAEIGFPCKLDLIDVLRICRAIQEGEKSRTYTLVGFNCYFFSLAIQCCLTRLVADWHNAVPYERWRLERQRSMNELLSASRRPPASRSPLSLLFRTHSILNPDKFWTIEHLLREVHTLVSGYPDLRGNLDCTLDSILWYPDINSVLKRLADEQVRAAFLQTLNNRLSSEQATLSLYPPRSTSSIGTDVEIGEAGEESEFHQMRSLGPQCMVELIELIKRGLESHVERNTCTLRPSCLRPFTSTSNHPDASLHRIEGFRETELPLPPVQTFTTAEWVLVGWTHTKSIIRTALYLICSLPTKAWHYFTGRPSARTHAAIEDELEHMLSRLECLKSIGPRDLIPFLENLRRLRRNDHVAWSEPPWTYVCNIVKERLPPYLLLAQAATRLKLRREVGSTTPILC